MIIRYIIKKIRDIKDIIDSFLLELRESNTSSYAAAAAFFMFLSAVPIVTLLCGILTLTGMKTDNLLRFGQMIAAPDHITMFLTQMVSEFSGSSAMTISVSSVIILWAAGEGVLAIRYGLDAARDFTEKKSVISLRISSSLYTIIFAAFILFSMVIMVMGDKINELLIKVIPHFNLVIQLLLHFRFLFSWVFSTMLFVLMYKYLPGKRIRHRKNFPGALFASVAWSVVSWLYSVYVDHFNGFSYYGSFTAVVITLFYLYIIMYIIFIGEHINIIAEKLYTKKTRRGKGRA